MSPLEAARRIVADALGLQPQDIPEEGDMFTIPGWDSIVHIKIILGTEEYLGTRLEIESAVNLTSISDIARNLQHSG